MPARAPELHRPQRATLSGRSSLSASLIDLSDVSSQEESQLDSASRLGLSSLAPFAPPACPYSQMLARTRSQDLTDSDPWLHTSMLSGGLASPPDPKQHHESLSFLPVPHTPNLSEGPPAPSAPDPTSHQQQPWQQGTSPCFPPLDFLEVCVHVLSDHFPDMEVATEAIAQSLQMAYPRRKIIIRVRDGCLFPEDGSSPHPYESNAAQRASFYLVPLGPDGPLNLLSQLWFVATRPGNPLVIPLYGDPSDVSPTSSTFLVPPVSEAERWTEAVNYARRYGNFCTLPPCPDEEERILCYHSGLACDMCQAFGGQRDWAASYLSLSSMDMMDMESGLSRRNQGMLSTAVRSPTLATELAYAPRKPTAASSGPSHLQQRAPYAERCDARWAFWTLVLVCCLVTSLSLTTDYFSDKPSACTDIDCNARSVRDVGPWASLLRAHDVRSDLEPTDGLIDGLEELDGAETSTDYHAFRSVPGLPEDDEAGDPDGAASGVDDWVDMAARHKSQQTKTTTDVGCFQGSDTGFEVRWVDRLWREFVSLTRLVYGLLHSAWDEAATALWRALAWDGTESLTALRRDAATRHALSPVQWMVPWLPGPLAAAPRQAYHGAAQVRSAVRRAAARAFAAAPYQRGQSLSGALRMGQE